jgi:glycosyltransferase involved in cell wall biosynthesis
MRLTIVTINLNDAKGLHRTLKSLESLLSEHVENLVIDGGSTDGSQEYLADWKESKKPFVRVIVESDAGIFNAMNKGWLESQGQYVAYINSGDEVIPKAYAEFVEHLHRSDADICYAKIIVRSEDGATSRKHEKHPVDFLRSTIPHPSAAVKRDAFLMHGGFDEQYRICADREFFVRLSARAATFSFLNKVIAVFYEGGTSSNRKQARLEDLRISRRYGLISPFKYAIKLILFSARVRFFG